MNNLPINTIWVTIVLVILAVQVNTQQLDEYFLTSKVRWDYRWSRNEPIVVYLNLEYCEEVASSTNSSCVNEVRRKAVFFPSVDSLALLEVPDCTS